MSQTGSAREGTGSEQLHVITSFHLKVSRDVLEDNIKIALLHARTRGVATTHILLEGDKEELFARIEVTLAEHLAAMAAEGRVVVSTITKRPSYFDMFAYANKLGAGYVAVANSDILFPVETVERI